MAGRERQRLLIMLKGVVEVTGVTIGVTQIIVYVRIIFVDVERFF